MLTTNSVKSSPKNEKLINAQQASNLLNLPIHIIREWDRKGFIRVREVVKPHRFFNPKELIAFHNIYQGLEPKTKFKTLKSQRTNFSVIELFSGCGGMALGLENAGLNTKLLVEIDKNCVNTLKLNRPKWNVMENDISNINFKGYRGEIDIVAAGLPCQPFSYAGLGKGFEDTRGTLFFELARCVKEIKPKIILIENVPGLLSHDQGRTIATIEQILKKLGYRVSYKILKSQFFDVPQKRGRVIIIGVRKDLGFEAVFPKEKNYIIPLKAALHNCPESIGVQYSAWKKQFMDLVPPGGDWRDLSKKIQKKFYPETAGSGHTTIARRLSWDEPCVTLTCSPSQKLTERCHPSETRPLKIREYARIQAFPDNWQFAGSMTSQYKQIGNAVPVNLAYHLGRCLITMLQEQI